LAGFITAISYRQKAQTTSQWRSLPFRASQHTSNIEPAYFLMKSAWQHLNTPKKPNAL
jgi:hypothetical protein